MSDLVYPDAFIRRVLDQTSTIAMVGASANWVRPSNFAMKYLQQKGYRVVPVNPGNAGNEIHGETCYAGLVDVPAPFEMVDIFRRPEDASGIVDEAISLKDDKGIRVIWMQIGVIDEDAAARAEAAGGRRRRRERGAAEHVGLLAAGIARRAPHPPRASLPAGGDGAPVRTAR